jgi:predicted transcriptional regulator
MPRKKKKTSLLLPTQGLKSLFQQHKLKTLLGVAIIAAVGIVTVMYTRAALMGAPGDALLESVMVRNPERLRAEDSLERIAQHPAWRRLHALPVVDEGGRYLGALRYSAFRTIETELGQAASGVDSGKSAAALAELYSVGGGALLQWASMALTPPDDRKRGGSS